MDHNSPHRVTHAHPYLLDRPTILIRPYILLPIFLPPDHLPLRLNPTPNFMRGKTPKFVLHFPTHRLGVAQFERKQHVTNPKHLYRALMLVLCPPKFGIVQSPQV